MRVQIKELKQQQGFDSRDCHLPILERWNADQRLGYRYDHTRGSVGNDLNISDYNGSSWSGVYKFRDADKYFEVGVGGIAVETAGSELAIEYLFIMTPTII